MSKSIYEVLLLTISFIRKVIIHEDDETSSAEAIKPEDDFRVGDMGFWIGLGATKGHMFDSKLSSGIISFFNEENVTFLHLSHSCD
jgi:hypothetical protein